MSIHNETSSHENPEQPSLFDEQDLNQAQLPHPGIIPIEEGGERPPEDAVSLPTDVKKEDIPAVATAIAGTLPKHPGFLADTPASGEQQVPQRHPKRTLIAALTALAITAGGAFIGYKLFAGDSETPKTKPVAGSTPTPGKTSTPTPAETTSAPSSTTPEPTQTAEVSNTPHITMKELAANIDSSQVNELLTRYPKLANYLQLPGNAQASASDTAIAKQRKLIHEVFSDPNITNFLPTPSGTGDFENQYWFTKDAILNPPSNETAGLPITAFPDFAMNWAGFFMDAKSPNNITPEADKLIKMAYLNQNDAEGYEQSIAGQGQIAAYGKALHSYDIGVSQTSDGKLFEGTVTEYAPIAEGTNGRAYVRWSLILPNNGTIEKAPEDADFTQRASEEFLGEVPAN